MVRISNEARRYASANYSSVMISTSEVLQVVEDVLRRFHIASLVYVTDVTRVFKGKVIATLQFSERLNLPVIAMIVVAQATRVGKETTLHIECTFNKGRYEHPTITTVLSFLRNSILERLDLLERERLRSCRKEG